MTETNNIAPVETTTTSAEVSQPIRTSKPYDDDMLQTYEAEAKNESESAVGDDENSKGVEKSAGNEAEDAPNDDTSAEETTEESEEVTPGERKGDKVDDGFEKVQVKRTINGKEVEFSVEQAIQAYVAQEDFNRNMDRRLSHVRNLEKRWESEQTQFKSKIGQVIEEAQGGDFIKSIRALAKLATAGTDLDVVDFEKRYFNQLDKVHEVMTKMSPEQREAYWAKRSASEAKARAKALEEEKEQVVSRSQLESEVVSAQKQHGLSQDEFWGNYKFILDNAVGEGKHFKSRDDVKIEDVVNYSLAVRHEAKVAQAGEKLGISDEAILDEVSRVTKSDPTLTVEDIVSVITKAGLATNASRSAVENLNRKAQKSGAQFGKASSAKKENGKIEGYDEESLEFLYRNQPRNYTRVTR